jgi:hypothetical protein
MAFINWGSESEEQLKIRKRLEEEMMFEQVSYSAAVSAAAAAAAGAGGRIREAILEITVDSTETLTTELWCINSSSPTTFTVDWGDGDIEEYEGGNCIEHTYSTDGIWNVVITFANPALITSIDFND